MKLTPVLFFFLLIALSINGFAQTSAELKRKKEALQREIELAQKNLNKVTKGKKLTLSQINALKSQIRLRQEKISAINSEMKNLDSKITENTGKVHNLQNRLQDLKKDYAAMIRFAQRNKNAYDKMMFIFAAKDFNQAYKRIKYLQQFGQYRKKQAAYIQGTQSQLKNQNAVLDKDLKNKTSLLKEQESEKGKLDKNRQEQTSVLNKFSKEERQYKGDLKKKRQQIAAVDKAIKATIAREIAKAQEEERERIRIAAAKAKAEGKEEPEASTGKAKTNNELLRSSPADAKLSAGFENNKGNLPWPVDKGYISSHFGSYMVDQASARNDGVTFQTEENASVRAVFGGVVGTIAPVLGKYLVIIRHGEYFTSYSNLKSVSVSKGATVSAKQIIGAVASGDGDVPELGFQINRGAAPQNPESWIRR